MATCSALLAWRILWTEEPGGATIHRGPKESDTTEQLTAFTLSFCLNKIVFPLPEKKKKERKICLSMQGTFRRSLVSVLIPHTAEQLSVEAATTQTLCYNY